MEIAEREREREREREKEKERRITAALYMVDKR